MKKQMILTLLLLAGMLSAFSAWGGTSPGMAAGDVRVFDEAGLFSEADTAGMEETIAGLRTTMNMDVVVVTTSDSGGKSSESYADDFYDGGGFGTGRDDSGALFLIDMDNREIHISTAGTMIRFLTDTRIDSMLDHAYGPAGNGEYARAAESFLEDLLVYYKKGIPGGQYNYDRETGKVSRYYSIRWYEALIALTVSAGCGLAACLNVKREYAMRSERQKAAGYHMAYRANARFAFRNRSDTQTDSFVTQRILPRSTGSGDGGSGGSSSGRSTTHQSGSGRSHGGGGRRF